MQLRKRRLSRGLLDITYVIAREPDRRSSVAVARYLYIYRHISPIALSFLSSGMETAAEAFLLLSLPKCTLSVKDYTETSPLGLQCVTVPLPDASSDFNMNVYLVLRLNMSETPIDPARIVHRTMTPATRVYTFNATSAEPDELVLTVSCPPGDKKSSHLHEDLETFESILEQYAIEFRCSASPGTQTQIPSIPPPTYVNDQKNLHGHLVMINEDTGEIVGEVEDRFRIQEDPMMYQQGHENDPVVIEVPDEGGLREEDANALAAFARIVPPDEQDWITKSATVVRCVPSMCTYHILCILTLPFQSCDLIWNESVNYDDHHCF